MHRFITLLVSLALAIPLFASPDKRPIDLSSKGARISRGEGANALTPPSQARGLEIVRSLLASQGRGRAAQSLVVATENRVEKSGVTHFWMEQEVAGLSVYGTYVKAAVASNGQVTSFIENVVDPSTPKRAAIDESAALAAALAHHYPDRSSQMMRTLTPAGRSGNATHFNHDSFWWRGPIVTRVAIPMESGVLVEGFLVETWEHQSNILWHTVVDGEADVVYRELRTNTDRYKIFPDHPGNSTQTIMTGPAPGTTVASPLGWVTNDTTIGNNVDAYLDRNNSNSADPNGRPISSTRDFLYDVDLTVTPTTTTNQMAAVTNLFYLNNVIHDKLYQHGFVESARNFQLDNFGRGGAQNDPVNAEAQDGGGTNNANFSTPSDGSRPRMQMYLWTQTTPHRDGDLDSDIVWHEYGHGLTWRMIGSMSGPLAGAIGEGMSDTLSIYINRNDVVGEYSYARAGGIRRYPYTNYPLTYKDVKGSSVHSDGEIYAATMWKLLELWEAAGYTQDELFDAVVGGMNYTPSRPAYEDMRDGILAASPTQEKDCVVWTAFAQFGIGEGAEGRESCRVFSCSVSITESMVVPSVCSGGGTPNQPPSVTITSPASGTVVTQGTEITFTGTASDPEEGNLSSSISWSSSINNVFGSGSSVTTSSLSAGNHAITASVTDNAGATGSASISVTVNAPAGGGITLTATGYKVKGVKTADLSWSGASSTSVDIYRDNVKVTTIPNSGSYTDSTGQKGGGSHTYRVCEAGTSSCSNNVTVNF
jgi:extracellular elastinolytic metalloproteinase